MLSSHDVSKPTKQMHTKDNTIFNLIICKRNILILTGAMLLFILCAYIF